MENVETEKKVYNFNAPVRGEMVFSVEASSYEEAYEKWCKEEYLFEPEYQDLDVDTEWREPFEYMKNCYTLSTK